LVNPRAIEKKTSELLRDMLAPFGPVVVAEWPRDALLARVKVDSLRKLATSYNPPKHGGRVVSGPTGLGKSLAAVATIRRVWCRPLAEQFFADNYGFMQALLAGRQPRILWARAFDLPNARLQQKFGTGESTLVERAKRADFLVLDDLGRESKRAGAEDVVEEIVFDRYDSGRLTIVTTGLRVADLLARYGDAVVRKVTESGNLTGAALALFEGEAA
jgi:DNA replication protein DnaC